MRKSLFALLISLAFCRAQAAYELVWSDEFDCASLNTSVWTYETGTGDWGWGNGESQYYTNRTDNVRIEDGKLVITAKKENYSGSAYTSGRIKTAGKVQAKYGRIEARIKVPMAAAGVWPAFWMLGTGASGWPFQGEFDIMEVMCTEESESWRTVLNTYHWNLKGMDGDYDRGNYGLPYVHGEVLSNDYHIYGLEWTPTEVRGYFKASENSDEVTVCTMYNGDATNRTNGRYAFVNYEAYMILNVALGGSYVSYKVDESFQSGDMRVDWVRIYQDKTAYPASSLTDKSSECAVSPAGSCDNLFAAYTSAACTVNEGGWWHDANGVVSVAATKVSVAPTATYTDMYAMAQGSLATVAAGDFYTLSGTVTADRNISVRVYVESKDNNQNQMFTDNTIVLTAGVPQTFSVSATSQSGLPNPVLVLAANNVPAGASFTVEDAVLRPSLCPTTAVERVESAGSAVVCPNPASDVARVVSDKEVAAVRLYDSAGRFSGECRLRDGHFSVAEQPAGFYFLQVIYRSGESDVLKLIKK